MPKNYKRKSSKPKGVALMKKQVEVLMKRTAAAKPEVKYIDLQTSLANSLFGVNTPFQSVISYPAIGTGQGARIGDKINNLRLQMKGQVITQSYNITGGYVWIMVLSNRLNTGSGVYSLASLYKPDVRGYINPLCHRDHENKKDWRIVKTVKLFIDHDGVLGNLTTGFQNATKNFDITVKLPSPMFDGASIIGNAYQIVAFCNDGLNGSFATGSGFEILLNQRLYYNDA